MAVSMEFNRRLLHHGLSPTGTPVVLSEQAIERCWFELHRQGGCGACEFTLSNEFIDRDQIEIGDWVSFEYKVNDRWYLGRVEERTSSSPAQTRFRAEGMSIQLNEVFPGGFGEAADGAKPHRYAGTDLFTHDPDRDWETFDSVASTTEMLEKLLVQYVQPRTDISMTPEAIEEPEQAAPLSSLKFRGEESVRSLLKDLSVRCQGASWGVDEQGEFFFLKRKTESLGAYREGLNLTKVTEVRDREFLFNRILLTGDYIYDRREESDMIARRSFRWRGNFIEPISQAAHGDRRIRLWLPWVRTQADSLAFAQEFFRIYSQPTSRYLIESTAFNELPKPWQGKFAIYDREGELLTFQHAETIRVEFDHQPRLRMLLGPLNPRDLWAEPPQDERWELPDQLLSAGGDVSQPPSLSIGDPPPLPPDPPPPPPPWTSYPPSTSSSLLSSEVSSGPHSSLNSSGPYSSLNSSGYDSSINSTQPDSSGSSQSGSLSTTDSDSLSSAGGSSGFVSNSSDQQTSGMNSESSGAGSSSHETSSHASDSASSEFHSSQSANSSMLSEDPSSQFSSAESTTPVNSSSNSIDNSSDSSENTGQSENSSTDSIFTSANSSGELSSESTETDSHSNTTSDSDSNGTTTFPTSTYSGGDPTSSQIDPSDTGSGVSDSEDSSWYSMTSP